MVKHVYYKKASDRLYFAFVGKMDKETKLERKRDQRHRRETTAKLDRTVSDYVRCKYPSIYAEAEDYYTELSGKYPKKKDLIKTVEHTSWKKGTRDRRAVSNRRMQLKIPLLQNERKTTEAIDTTATSEETGPVDSIQPATETIDTTATSEETGPVDSIQPATETIDTTATSEETGPVDSIQPATETIDTTATSEETEPGDILTELNEAVSYINEEIPDHMIQEIMNELKADMELHEFCLSTFPDNVEMLEEE